MGTTASIQNETPNLAGMSRQSMRDLFAEMGEKPFHADQVMKWIHQRGVTELDAMTDISKSLREKLRSQTCLLFPEVVAEYPAGDGCHKWLLRVASGSQVEMVFIPESGRGTLCVSSQAGCTLDCDFCATGKQGFNSNLTSAEIIGQVWWATRHLKGFGSKNRSVTNVVMMGMGEPLLNFDPVMEAMDIMMADQAYGLSKRRVTISTSGVVPGLRKMIGRTSVSLAISLHAPNDELRSKIMPINRRYPIAELLDAATAYMDSLTDKRVPVVEYTLIAGVNDHRQHARDLAVLLQDFPCKINLIPFNPFDLSDYRRPSSSAVSNFRQILQQAGYTVTVRTTRADDIGAACGQLVGEVADQTLRSERHRNRRNQASQSASPDSGAPAVKGAAKREKSFTSADNLAVSADSL